MNSPKRHQLSANSGRRPKKKHLRESQNGHFVTAVTVGGGIYTNQQYQIFLGNASEACHRHPQATYEEFYHPIQLVHEHPRRVTFSSVGHRSPPKTTCPVFLLISWWIFVMLKKIAGSGDWQPLLRCFCRKGGNSMQQNNGRKKQIYTQITNIYYTTYMYIINNHTHVTLHYITLPYLTLHYITLHYIALHDTWHTCVDVLSVFTFSQLILQQTFKTQGPQTRPSWDSPKPGPSSSLRLDREEPPGPRDADSYLALEILGPRPRGRPPMVLDRRWWIPSFYPNKLSGYRNQPTNVFFGWKSKQLILKSRKKLWLPSRETDTYPTYRKGKSSTQKCRLGKGYVSSRESNSFRTFRVWESCR